MVKLLNALNTYGVLADDKNLDFLVDVLRALKYVPKPQDAPCSDGCGDPKSCVTFYPWHGSFEFFPGLINGVDNPPDGYAQHPWFTGDRYVVPGFTLDDTDVLADFVSTRPDGSITGLLEQIAVSGLPRFRFTFEALTAGTAYVHLLDVPLGGYALVRLDETQDIDLLITDGLSLDDLLEAVGLIGQIVDDLIDLDPAELIPEHIHELSFGPGQHTIDVLLLPRVELPNLTAIGWGGGIRKIVICGEETVCPDPEENMPRPQLRSIPDPENVACKIIQWKYESEGDTLWRNLATVCDGADGAPGEQGPPGDCGCPDPAEDDRDIPPPTNVDDTCALARRLANHIVDAYGIWAQDIAYALYTQGRSAADLASDMEDFLYSGSSGIFQSVITGDTYEFTNLWEFYVSSFFSAPLAGGVFWSNIVALVNGYQALNVLELQDKIEAELDNITCAWLDALDDDLTVTQGEWDGFKSALAARIEDSAALGELEKFLDLIPLSRIRALARQANDDAFDCTQCELDFEWCIVWDWRLDDYQFSGNWVLGTGFESQLTINQSAQKKREIGFGRVFGNTAGSNSFTVVGARLLTAGGVKGDNWEDLRLRIYNRATSIPSEPDFLFSDWEGTRDRLILFSEPRLVNAVDLECIVGFNGGALGVPDPGGYIAVNRLILYGTGTLPTWEESPECD